MEKIETVTVRDDSLDRAPVYVERRSILPWLLVVAVVALGIVAAFAFGLIDINQTQKGALPDVKVETSGGAMPSFDVDTANVNVETKTEAVSVPQVQVGSTTREVEVPSVSIDRANTVPND
ncbi:MAG TPA: hypothetical protein PK808_13010 [Polymorphobacter sp.]|jgi:hypothetical protein|nr:hypothetical protein [Polymorphobacter sp.]